jgi:hypothetical protein
VSVKGRLYCFCFCLFTYKREKIGISVTRCRGGICVRGDKVRESKRLSNGRHDETGMKREDIWNYSYVCALYLYSRDIVVPRTGDSQLMN